MPESVDKAEQASKDRLETAFAGISFLLFGAGVYWFVGFGGVLIYLALLFFAGAMALRSHKKSLDG